MDDTIEVSLHYAMLEYLFDNRKLGASCFAYAWEDLIRHDRAFSNYNSNQLKTIFWTIIAANIENYQLLTDEQKEYFDPDNFLVSTNYEELQSVLENNEPKAGIDFTFHQSTSAYNESVYEQPALQSHLHEDMMKSVKDVFKKPTICKSTFGGAVDDDDDDDEDTDMHVKENSRINVIAQKPEPEFDIGESPLTCFKAMMLTDEDVAAGITVLSDEQMYARLANPNFEFDLPDGMKFFLSKFDTPLLDTYKPLAPKSPMKAPAPVKKTFSPFGAHAVSSTPLITATTRQTRSSTEISAIERQRRNAYELSRIKSPSRVTKRLVKTPSKSQLSVSKSDSDILNKK